MMAKRNFMSVAFAAVSQNEAFARVAVASFISQLDISVEELEEIKTVVSEAVTNSIIHGYDENPDGVVRISVSIDEGVVELVVEDEGKGIEDVDQAMQPLFTSKPELERSGMGFTIMENFMDSLEVATAVGKGTTVRLTKRLSFAKALQN
ncbi:MULTISPECIES: anti-sigma F factor [Brevibacillus]|jgi:stage II sporulation protein AB (anti-sigma F factor)|uniref:Anti-sigma F factor n=1 Tax=Brevibacillus borstelensis AK1 TaxID=1300222 RepID=M8DBL5_9BACL|nr:anti-sigma F factor [Brevibacillus borstelensis]EMT53674.1 anti-sigma-F factor [Brevibacillus borstelensis AK1]KKX56909.1 anti-sigma F factor [Brevibacillus borstelensis cifa_chp40]MBE5397716.1 anti-sigma F factor [Brevibacillus borstelensis]MCC0562654.1 anti-sigma F factor [Brevibacillus borstelensis]MCM3469738.1 anti-sigma F factor [Brevibacillus borstelensis]